ncbi:hypothetical protein [Paenalcaligenes suwonensis]|uniref:hypothetical protein n=1 Tax=Paenalcaligenes suwonensis TaxID=1202713 RepID=UPI00140E5678|nr:hypothetical protein [Paenalcaligenes suwonensis]NHC62993.1 hypothetical protein [Paenalcaligenes suwonensis]
MFELTLVNQEHFPHIRIIIGMIMGISVARLVVGVSEFLQHPERKKIYVVHLGWVLFVFLAIIHFWWYEFGLTKIRVWSFGLYLFLISYACFFVFIASMLFPSSMTDYKGYKDYFQSRRRTFYTMFAMLAVIDLIDTAMKGTEHFESLGVEYPIQQVTFIALALIALVVRNQTYQIAFVTAALLYKIFWIYRLYWVLT